MPEIINKLIYFTLIYVKYQFLIINEEIVSS